MEKITNIEIKNFKSIRHAEIKDCRRINVFIGYPNVGKSNILEALGIASIGSSNSNLNIDDFVRVEDSTSIFFNGDTATPFQIIFNDKVRAKGVYMKEKIDIDFEWNSGNFSFKEIEEKTEKAENHDTFQELRDSVSSFIKYSIVNGGISSFQETAVLDLETKRRINTPRVKKFLFNNKVKQVDGSSSELEQPDGKNIFSVLSANENLRKEVAELFHPYDLKFPFDKSTKSFKILKNVGEDIFIISYKMIADTLRRLIFYKTAIRTNKNSVLLFEEPEAQMFPPYIKKLTTDILMDQNNNQYFIATHSPYVLDELILEAGEDLAVYLVDYKNGETIIQHLSNEDLIEIRQYGVDLFFNIESYLKHGQVDHS